MSKARRKGKFKPIAKSGDRATRPRKKPLFTLFAIFLLAGLGLLGWAYFHNKIAKTLIRGIASTAKQPANVEDLLAMTPVELEKCDIALMDLICARGLRGSEGLDINECLKTLDGWTERVKWETQRHLYKFYEHPEQFQHSLGRYRMMMLGTVLAQDVGIHYDPAIALKIAHGETPINAWDSDSKDMFIHGLLTEKHSGTCASMPVLYVAIGRRLGYPVSLASTKIHLYVWYAETNGGHFNFEATMIDGFLTPTDEDYQTDVFKCTPEEIQGFGWLRPLSNKESLGQFLLHRAINLTLVRHYREAKQTFLAAARCLPDTPLMRDSTAKGLRELDLAPFGDRIDDLRNEVTNLVVPDGTKFAYLENRKGQVSYFLGDNTNWPSMERAVNDLEYELAEYKKELASPSADMLPETIVHDPNVLVLTHKSGRELRLATAGLPPPLNTGACPPDYMKAINHLDLTDEGLVWDALWQHYKSITPDWMAQADKLPPRPLSPH